MDTLLLSLPDKHPDNQVPSVSQGGLTDKYNFVQLHFHWSSDPKNGGSEHLINSKRFAAEMHLVHYNTKYSSFADATNHPDGLAVLGVMLDSNAGADHQGFAKIVQEAPSLAEAGAEKTLTNSLSLKDLLPNNLSTFYRYDGSLTTPKFAEIVTWTVFDNPIPVSESQVEVLNQLKDHENKPLTDNYREVQPLNGRKIFYNNPSKIASK